MKRYSDVLTNCRPKRLNRAIRKSFGARRVLVNRCGSRQRLVDFVRLHFEIVSGKALAAVLRSRYPRLAPCGSLNRQAVEDFRYNSGEIGRWVYDLTGG